MLTTRREVTHYWGLQKCHSYKPYTIQTVSASVFQWGPPQPWWTPACSATLLWGLLTATDMPPLRAIYYSNCHSEWIPMRASPTVVGACLVSYHSFKSTESNRNASAASHIQFNLSQQAGSNGVLPDLFLPLDVEIPFILYVPRHFLFPEC